jgi:hypothetical protein
MATDEELLLRFMPKVCYDSLEAVFADHPLQNRHRRQRAAARAHRAVVTAKLRAAAPNIELGWPTYHKRTMAPGPIVPAPEGRDLPHAVGRAAQGSPRRKR